ncbi:unnamed protein product [Hermetia illucens]|uniref:Uncharacterized protein n=1 Tax=Hermetia illucens TaxID=343691 RepID=A0A7R8YYV3_HERIL|nr:unnamed protein product [Hermetia illucens]
MICEDSDPSIITNASCTTRSLNRTTKSHNLTATALPNVILNDIFVRITFHMRINTGYRRLIADVEENFCGFINGTSKSFLISILWPFVRTHSNLDHKCPFFGHLYVRNFIIKFDYFPPALPEGQSKLTIHIRNGRKRVSIMKVLMFFEIKPKGAANLNF